MLAWLINRLYNFLLLHNFVYQTDITPKMRPFDAIIPEEPQSPFPLLTQYCDIIAGFGRGSSDLGIPTANVIVDELPQEVNALSLGVYFGFARLQVMDIPTENKARKDGRSIEYNYGKFLNKTSGDLDVIPIVLSIGENPFYKNKFKTVELHFLHKFTNNFYGAQVKFNILGFIRDELDYTTVEALINDINIDISIAKATLNKPSYSKFKEQLL